MKTEIFGEPAEGLRTCQSNPMKCDKKGFFRRFVAPVRSSKSGHALHQLGAIASDVSQKVYSSCLVGRSSREQMLLRGK
jgi:hypothetical protein